MRETDSEKDEWERGSRERQSRRRKTDLEPEERDRVGGERESRGSVPEPQNLADSHKIERERERD